MAVRRATPGDETSIAEVYVRSWQHAFVGLVPQTYLDAMRPEDRVTDWEEILAATDWPRRGVFVLVEVGEHRGEVTGFVHLSPSRDHDADPGTMGEIQTVYLAPKAMGHGGGVALMEAALEEMRRAGYRRASLWALGTNVRARRFYERHGWRPDGATKRNDWAAFVRTDVRYVLDLGAPPTA